jgi:hypothetical protein
MWKKIRATVMFGIACLASPCCTPLIVPVIIALFAGTPIAVWMTQNVGLIYGVLTLVSVISLVLGLRWLNKHPQTNTTVAPHPANEAQR